MPDECSKSAPANAREMVSSFWDSIADSFSENTKTALNRNKWVGDRLSTIFPNRKDLRIADVGTGAGFMAISFAQLGHDVTATDISDRMLDHARANATAAGVDIEFIKDDITNSQLTKDHFDLVVLRDVMINLWDARTALTCVYNLIRPGGYVVISDGNYFLYRVDEEYRFRQKYYTRKFKTDRIPTGTQENDFQSIS